MKRRHEGMMGKLAAFFGALLILGTLVGVAAPAEAEASITKSESNTTLVTAGIGCPEKPNGRNPWSGSFVWFGNAKYNRDQVRYRVLSANSYDFAEIPCSLTARPYLKEDVLIMIPAKAIHGREARYRLTLTTLYKQQLYLIGKRGDSRKRKNWSCTLR